MNYYPMTAGDFMKLNPLDEYKFRTSKGDIEVIGHCTVAAAYSMFKAGYRVEIFRFETAEQEKQVEGYQNFFKYPVTPKFHKAPAPPLGLPAPSFEEERREALEIQRRNKRSPITDIEIQEVQLDLYCLETGRHEKGTSR